MILAIICGITGCLLLICVIVVLLFYVFVKKVKKSKALKKRLSETETTRNTADDFIRDIKKYLNAPELTREMCYELIERIIIGGSQSVTGKEREIEIVYKIDIVSVLRHKVKKYPV